MEFNIAIFIGGIQKGNKRAATPCLIGRSKTAALTVSHPAMSRIHCEIYEENGKLFLKDSGSLNGTVFNGQYLENPAELSLGSEFSIGELIFRITGVSPDSQKESEDIGKTTIIESVSPAALKWQNTSDLSFAAGSAAEPFSGKDEKISEPSPLADKFKKKVSPKEVRIIT